MFSKKKKDDVFVKLSDLSKKIHKSVVFFDEFINDFEDVEEKSSKMKELETECDLMTHKVIEALKASKEVSWLKTERYELIKVLDNIVDYIEEVAKFASIHFKGNILQCFFFHLCIAKTDSIQFAVDRKSVV